MDSGKPKVIVTGVSGYIGSWVAFKALETGLYEVSGTVRDKTNLDKIQPLKDGFGERFEDLRLVDMDLNNSESIDKWIAGYGYVIHVASPFVLGNPKDENEIIGPAVNGTTDVLKACQKHKVKRIVITSAWATIEEFHRGNMEVDESYFSEIDSGASTYAKSKILAERAVWDFCEKQENEEHQIEVVVLNPGFVLGPLLIKVGGTSQQLVTAMMNGTMNSIPLIYTMTVDVRDVADAHIKGLICEPFNRYAIVDKNYSFGDICTILSEKFNDKGFNIISKGVPKFLLWAVSWLDQEANAFYQRFAVCVRISNKKAWDNLGMKFIGIETSLQEMGESLIKFGFVVPE